ncbi:MAG: hypothetical protein HYY45_20565 [Deltaproteobacteria bacterium]|nr:hypothetical protein [Deltaproteobacteria bacterium]
MNSQWRIANGRWLAAACFSLFIFHFSFFTPLFAFDRTNVPLKNWGRFSIYRSWVYDALEKIVLAGLADQVLLNSKPLSRVEAARIVGQAVRRLEWDKYGDYNHRGYLEELLYQLVEEFGPELGEMGIKTPLNRSHPSGFFAFNPVDHAEFGMGSAGRSQKTVNNFGQRFKKGVNAASTLDGRAQVGDFLSFYYQPEFSRDRDVSHGRLLSGYGKLTLWNTELTVGRESLWWGPGFRGSMSFSNNAFPLDQVRLSSAEPFRLPWLLSYLGPVKASLFVSQLEENRDLSRAKVSGWRVGFAPSRFAEFGFNRMFQFGGKGRGTLNPGQYLGLLFGQGSDDPSKATNVNNVMSFDGTLRIPDVERYILFARDAAIYFDFGWDDTLFGLIVPDKPGGIVGTYLTGLFGDPKLDLRVEYARTSDIQFFHGIYTSGFTNRGSVLSHFIGTQGNDLYARLTRWIRPDLLLGFQMAKSHIGPTVNPLSTNLSDSLSFGFDVSYRFSSNSSVFLGYDFARLRNENRKNAADKGPLKNDNLFRIEFTRSFGQ